MMSRQDRLRFMFVSVNEVQWGGSEELWARAALHLAKAGHSVSIAKPNLDRNVGPVARLIECGCRTSDIAVPVRLLRPVFRLAYFASRPASFAAAMLFFWILLRIRRPDFVVVSQGGTWDAFHLARILRRYGCPYATISQKASDLYWPPDNLRDRMQSLYRHAAHSFFVSHHNYELTQEQVGEPIKPASVVRNPFLTDYSSELPWPDAGSMVDFACVGRLYPMEKGQDLVLRVLARKKWRNRPVSVTFYGAGPQRVALESMAAFLGVSDRARFVGHVSDVPGIWCEHPALLLASRAEGLPLVLVEAMLAGRVAITTDAGGSAEVIDDNRTAFLAHGATEDSLDDAMERAWKRRSEWPEIGRAASASLRQLVSADPAGDLADNIVQVATQLSARGQV